MLSIINYHEIEPTMLCKYIEQKVHGILRNHVVLAKSYVYQHLYEGEGCTTLFELVGALLGKIEDELEGIFRKEKLVVFPLIENKIHDESGAKIRPTWVDNSLIYHSKLIAMVDKLRQLTHHYQIKSEWSSAAKLGINELYEFDFHFQNWLQLEQTVLYPKLQKIF